MKKTVQTPWLARRSYGRENSWIGEIDFGMNLSIWKVLTMLMFLLCFANGLCLHFVFRGCRGSIRSSQAREAVYRHGNTDFTGVVTDVATDGTYIYCGYGWRYIIKVLDEEGNYIETIAVSDAHDPRGNFRLTEQETRLCAG